MVFSLSFFGINYILEYNIFLPLKFEIFFNLVHFNFLLCFNIDHLHLKIFIFMKDQIKKNALNMKDKIENRIKHEMLK